MLIIIFSIKKLFYFFIKIFTMTDYKKEFDQKFDLKYLNQMFSNDLEEKCSKFPTNNDTYDLVYSIGDIHGDYKAFHNIITHLVDKENKPIILYDEIIKKYSWNSEVSNICIIQTGDIIDGIRNNNIDPEYYENYKNDDLMIIDIMISLKEEAETTTNKIILLYGNHEIENIFNIINLREINYNNYLLSYKSKLSEIDFCTLNTNLENWRLLNQFPDDDEFRKYQLCQSRLGMFSVRYKNVNRFNSSEENINNYIYNKNLLTQRFNHLHKLKNKILCNYQTYAIINNYFFCHSGFISNFVEKIINIYYQYKSADPSYSFDEKNMYIPEIDKQISLDEFIKMNKDNQSFISIFNKIFTKIINYLWQSYDKEIKIEPSLKEFIDQYKQYIHDIIWSDNFRDFYYNLGEYNNLDNYKYVNNSINFILHHLHLNGIIMGHIAQDNIHKIKINNSLHDFYIYLTDITISRAFHPMNVIIDGKKYYNYPKFYSILQIDKFGNISYLNIKNSFTENVHKIDYNVTEINYSNLIDNHIIKFDLFKLIQEFIKNNDKILTNDIINSIYTNHDKIPDLIISYITDYFHIDLTSEYTYKDISECLSKLIDEIIMNKIIYYINNLVQSKKLNIFDIFWMYYAISNKKILTMQLKEEYKNLDIAKNCEQGLLKIYYNCDTIDKDIFISYYNKNISYINYIIKKELLFHIKNIIQLDLIQFLFNKDKIKYYLLLKILLLQKSKDYDEFVYIEIIRNMYDINNKCYYTNNFNMNLNKIRDPDERKNYLTELINNFKKNINIIINNKKITIESIINKICSQLIKNIFIKIIEYVKSNKLNKIRIKLDKNYIFSIENVENILLFNIFDLIKNNYKINNKILKMPEIQFKLLSLISSFLKDNYKFTVIYNDELLLYGEIIFF